MWNFWIEPHLSKYMQNQLLFKLKRAKIRQTGFQSESQKVTSILRKRKLYTTKLILVQNKLCHCIQKSTYFLIPQSIHCFMTSSYTIDCLMLSSHCHIQSYHPVVQSMVSLCHITQSLCYTIQSLFYSILIPPRYIVMPSSYCAILSGLVNPSSRIIRGITVPLCYVTQPLCYTIQSLCYVILS